MDDLYGDLKNEASTDIEFSPEALAQMLEDIYNGLDVKNEIQQDAFDETVRLFTSATLEGIGLSTNPIIEDQFIEEIRNNINVFSAFKVHRMQNDMASRLLDEKGKLKSFEKWVNDIEDIADHHVRRWLKTEYDTAILRAHQAADWKQFESEKDVLPNLRWMPTTSTNPDQYHKQYWQVKLTLPVGHPFWDQHRPGDRWNCKCSLRSTDEPATTEAIADFKPVPSEPGLDTNPGKTGDIFSPTHPYFEQHYNNAEGAVEKALNLAHFTSIDDAKRFIVDNGIAQRVSLDIKKADLPLMEKLLNQIALRMKEFAIPPFENLGKPRGRRAQASWDEMSNSLNLNISLLKKPEKAWDVEMKFRTKGTKYTPYQSVEDVNRHVIDHELGHKILFQYQMKNEAVQGISKSGVTRNGHNELMETLGYYASTDYQEYFAEAIGLFLGPGKETVGPVTKEMLDKLVEKVKKRKSK